MRKFIIFILAVFSFQSCEEKTNFPVSPDKMVKILADIHVAEAASGHLVATTKDSVLKVYYKQIMEIQEISKEDFDSTMILMRANPKWLEQLYSEVMEEINIQKANIKK